MRLDQALVDAAIAFVRQRFGGRPGEGAAAMYTADGEITVSTAIEVLNDSVAVCHETGAICEAYARDKQITATVCISMEEGGRPIILAPCGVCQERLWYWGGDLEAAVPAEVGESPWKAVALKDLAPHYWRKPFLDQ